MGYEVDFLPVGPARSGDAIALRTGNLHGHRSEQFIAVIDGGFEESGNRLVEHITETYMTDSVDLVVSTHADADHAAGLEAVLTQLKVGSLWMHQPWNHTDDIARMFRDGRVTDASVRAALRRSLDNARTLERLAAARGIPIVEPFAGVCAAGGLLCAVGPTQEFYEGLLPGFRGTPEPKTMGVLARAAGAAVEGFKYIAEAWGIETLDDSGETSAENDSSAILLARIDGEGLLFTADAGQEALTRAIDLLERSGIDLGTIKFVQVPHHGSQRNVGPRLLDRLLGPKRAQDVALRTAFVSAAPDGGPKHPSKKVTNAFRRRGAPVHATLGVAKCHRRDAPNRGWVASTPLPFYSEVEE